MTGIITIAISSPAYGRMATNLALSIKTKTKIPICVIYSKSAFEGMEWALDYFDNKIEVDDTDSAAKEAMRIKLHLDVYTPYDKTLFLDADVIICPSKDVWDFIMRLSGRTFTAQCFAINNIADKPNPIYEHWMDYKDIAEEFPMLSNSKIPQINSSLIYFEGRDVPVFGIARLAYETISANKLKHKKWRGQIPDELCFNLACAWTGQMPHKKSFRPIELGGFQSKEFIIDNYLGFSPMGTNVSERNIGIYNDFATHYANVNGLVKPLLYEKKEVIKRPIHPLLPHKKHVIASIGGFGKGSEGGIINPSVWKEGDYYKAILRVDDNLEGYRGKKDKAICRPYLATYDNEFKLIDLVEQPIVGIFEGVLFEDFRLHKNGEWGCCAGYINGNWNQFLFLRAYYGLIIYRHFKTNRDEKNWAWFDNRNFIYSVEPYIVKDWQQNIVIQHDFDSGWRDSGFISCSTSPVRYGDDWLVWVHKKQKDLTYLNSVMVVDGTTFLPKYFIPQHVLGSEGIDQPLYISSCVVEDDRIIIFGGEGGIPEMSNAALKHSTVRIIDRKIFDKTIKQHPCK